ncbi:GNAT family N-acetyltransferase [Prauserella oleivorans]|uniref:GNAT family N-acetyltransferase n=1 Tax=Prauserella oleivorans TaxID=1478153 RepID=A0ABW5WFC9_9PSEU
MTTQDCLIAPAPVADAESAELLRRYFADLSLRYYRRPATEAELDAAMSEDPSDDLVPPHGVFLMARIGGVVAGCAGVRRRTGFGELTRMFVLPEFRGRGVAGRLLVTAEDHARAMGLPLMRLNTRLDLLEARALYARHGYREIPSYGDAPYAECWFERELS